MIGAGRLVLDSPGGTSCWFVPVLEGNICIEYKVTMVDAGGKNDRISDNNCFWMVSDPERGDAFLGARGGEFREYDDLACYYVGMGGNGNTTTRFRRYPRTDRILVEHSDPEHLIRPNFGHQIELVCLRDRVQYWADGVCYVDWIDPQPYTRGRFAFRTVHSHFVAEDFRVWRIEAV